MVTNYYKMWTNIYRACYNTLDEHVNDFQSCTADNSTNNRKELDNVHRGIFNQLTTTYGKPTPDAMRQNNITFLAPYNPQESPEILFKRSPDVKEIATLAKNPYTTQQLLINALDLIAR